LLAWLVAWLLGCLVAWLLACLLAQSAREISFQLNLVLSGVAPSANIINRANKKIVYSFQTLSLPFLSGLRGALAP